MNQLAEWSSMVCADLGVDKAKLDSALILEMARTVKRTVAKPAAPRTAYLSASRSHAGYLRPMSPNASTN
jgi:hypothetical protein